MSDKREPEDDREDVPPERPEPDEPDAEELARKADAAHERAINALAGPMPPAKRKARVRAPSFYDRDGLRDMDDWLERHGGWDEPE